MNVKSKLRRHVCVFFLNTGVFLENRSGIHCFQIMLVVDTALRSNVKLVTQFSQTAVLLLQQGGRRHYPATMTSFTSNRTAFSRSNV